MGVGPRTPITAPPNRQATAGLIALGIQDTPEDPRWEGGFGFDPETCDDGLLYDVACATATAKEMPEPADLVTVDPVLIVGSDTCTTLSTGRDGRARANRHLLSVQSHHLERAWWTGEATDDAVPDGGSRPHLADGTATVLSAAAIPAGQAVAVLDQALTACLHGQQGMVHLTPVALTVIAGTPNLLERVDGRWLTPNGHLVVAGSGYTGGAPRPNPGDPLPAAPNLLAVPPANQWIYGTAMVHVLLGAISIFDDVDRSINNNNARAERPAAAYAGCCKFATNVDLTP